MNDDGMKTLFHAALNNSEPVYGLQERMLTTILTQEQSVEHSAERLSTFERILFEKPLRFACMSAIGLSALLYALFGNGYIGILSSALRIG